MAMEQVPQPKAPRGRDGKRTRDGEGREGRESRNSSKYTPKLLGKAYFQRKKGCPFSGPKAPKIDYKDVRLLTKFISDYGKILPRHLTGVSALKQRELANAIKRARMLALLPFTGATEQEPRAPRAPRAPREARVEDKSAE